MIATRMRRWAPLAFFAAVWSTTPAPAQSAAAWDGRSELRLIAGARRGEELRAGVELRLAPGWKTYWRYPGDAGVPPRFDFARSTNVKSVTVLWPAPQRMSEEVGQSIGYKDVVIFPLRVAPQDPARPVTLRLNLDYAVCEKLCVPAEGSAELVLDGAPAHEVALAAAEARVPRPAAVGDQAAFAIRAVRREGERVVVDVAAPPGANVDLFAEGPTPEWALPLPSPMPDAPAPLRRFAFALDGLPAGARADGATLTLTATAGEAAIEVKARLD